MVDVEEFLSRHGIPYETTGKNVAKGHVVVKCPFCGADDPSMHMGISVEDGKWGCWRSRSHRGRSFARIVAALLGIPLSRAQQLVGSYEYAVDEFDQVREKLLGSQTRTTEREYNELPWPSHTYLIDENAPQRYRHFLVHDRGFGWDWTRVAQQYELTYSLSERWANRVLVPCSYNGVRVAYTGRLVADSARHFRLSNRPRYKAVEKSEATLSLSEIVYRPPCTDFTGEVLIVTEGPFDAINLDYRLRSRGIRATCLFGLAYTEDQVYDLLLLAESFSQVWIMLDAGTESHAYELAEQLVSVNPGIVWLSRQLGDPGALPREKTDQLGDSLLCESGRTITLA